MISVIMTPNAEDDLEAAFDYYEMSKAGLGIEMLTEFRHGINAILGMPEAWALLGRDHRGYKLFRFPYVIIYHIDNASGHIIIAAFSHQARRPDWWRK